MPEWDALLHDARPPLRDADVFEPGGQRSGWQHEATSRVEQLHRERNILPALAEHEKALLRAQGGSGGGRVFSVVPSCFLTRIDTHLFRVLLLRRLHLPLSPASCFCRCGRPLDSRGHHRAACAQAGVLGRRGHAVEVAAARICREAGARVRTNVFVRDMDLGAPVHDSRRLENLAEGLPLYGGVQLAIDPPLRWVRPSRRHSD